MFFLLFFWRGIDVLWLFFVFEDFDVENLWGFGTWIWQCSTVEVVEGFGAWAQLQDFLISFYKIDEDLYL